MGFGDWKMATVIAYNEKVAKGRLSSVLAKERTPENFGGQGDKGLHAPTRKVLDTRQGLTPDSLIIKGQIRGGKNNMIVTRNGLHFPKKEWAKWRDDAVKQVLPQLKALIHPIEKPTNIRLDYYAGDNRRRDMPAIVDAIFHVLEKSGFVKDDTLLWVAQSTRNLDKENPRAEITIL